MNWGYKITIFFTGFVIFILFMVYKTTTVKSELVAENYYEQEIEYQDKIDKIKNAKSLDVSIQTEVTNEGVLVTFPQKEVSGELYFFRASDQRLDYKIPIQTDSSGVQLVQREHLMPGFYTIKADWMSDLAYYSETPIFIQP